MITKKATTTSHRHLKTQQGTDTPRPFIEHLTEVRIRLTWIALTVIGFSAVGYFISDTLLALLHRPIGETLYYTSPVGGLNFLIKLCFSLGFVLALPVIFYQLNKFFSPMVSKKHNRLIVRYSVYSSIMALAGVAFAYFISMPAALHFLMGFSNGTIESLVGVNEYYGFAIAYMLGYALLFQLPIIISFINKIKPLDPGSMMRAQRWVILFSFIVAAILTPTPDPTNQFIMAAPAIVFYQVGVFFVWVSNRNRKQSDDTLHIEQLNYIDQVINQHAFELDAAPEAPALAQLPVTRGRAMDIMPGKQMQTAMATTKTVQKERPQRKVGVGAMDVVRSAFPSPLVLQ